MLKNSLIALQGTVIAQGIGFLFMPALSRLYTPAAFGALMIYMSILNPALVVTALRYEMALLTAEKGRELSAVTQLCAGLNILSGAVAMGLCGAIQLWRPGLLGFSPLTVALLSLGVLGGGLNQTLNYVVIREKDLRLNAFSKVFQIGTYCLLGTLGALFGATQTGLIGADVAGRFIAAGLIVVGLIPMGWSAFSRFSIREIWSAAVKFRRFPLYSMTGGLISAAMGSVVPVFIAATFGAAVMGQYALVERVILAPAAIVGASVAQSFTVQLSSLVVAGEDALPTFWKVVAIMGAIGLAPGILLFFFSPWAFTLVFGSQWALAGDMASVVAILFVTTFAVMPVNMTLLLIQKQRQQLTWEISRFLLVFVIWFVMAKMAVAPLAALKIHVGALVVMNGVFLVLAHQGLYASRARKCGDFEDKKESET
jgi:O-antigen/teichoic acid export membrane protein